MSVYVCVCACVSMCVKQQMGWPTGCWLLHAALAQHILWSTQQLILQ